MIEITKYNVTEDYSSEIQITGNNQKGIIIVYPMNTAESELKLLDTIIEKAILVDPKKDVVKVALKSECKINWFQFMSDQKVAHVLCFGIHPRSLSLNFAFNFNELIPFQDVEYIFSNYLHEIESDQGLKKQLWSCIKSSTLT